MRYEGDILQSSNLKSFSFSELRTATRNFRPDSVLGEGGFGSVFKGWVDQQTLTPAHPGTGMVIAVKRLSQESFQGHNEWLVSKSLFCTSIYHNPSCLCIWRKQIGSSKNLTKSVGKVKFIMPLKHFVNDSLLLLISRRGTKSLLLESNVFGYEI